LHWVNQEAGSTEITSYQYVLVLKYGTIAQNFLKNQFFPDPGRTPPPKFVPPSLVAARRPFPRYGRDRALPDGSGLKLLGAKAMRYLVISPAGPKSGETLLLMPKGPKEKGWFREKDWCRAGGGAFLFGNKIPLWQVLAAWAAIAAIAWLHPYGDYYQLAFIPPTWFLALIASHAVTTLMFYGMRFHWPLDSILIFLGFLGLVENFVFA
jgi:hypothetical protein